VPEFTQHRPFEAAVEGEWLEGYLATYDGAVVIVSHDRFFLDRLANRIWELEGGGLHAYSGNYTDFIRQKEEELNILRKRTLIELISDVVKASAILVLLLVIARRTVSGDLSLGQMAMFLLAFRQGMTNIKDFLGSLAGLYEDGLYIGDTFEFLDLKESVTANPPVAIPDELKSGIRVEDISFTYPGNDYASLNKVSFEIKKGEIIALVGPNGAGKSTLVRLLTRLYDPDAGSVRWDGSDIRTMDPET